MFYHVRIGYAGLGRPEMRYNFSRDDVLSNYLCPFINRELTFWGKNLVNMRAFGSIRVFQTSKPIDSDWPINKNEYFIQAKDRTLATFAYEDALIDILIKDDVTQELFREAVILLESGDYTELRSKLLEEIKGKYTFFICPLENEEVNHNYEYVIKPTILRYHFSIEKADEISTTGTLTDSILEAITRSRFVVADLTDERPNCYYEVGYAHALGKPVIILAKKDTRRHFDISVYKWNFWTDYKDLKKIFEAEILNVLNRLKIPV